MKGSPANKNLYQKIYDIVRRIPQGRVMTYGQIASQVGNCGARNVGYAMAALSPESDVPWQRVINAKGEISRRADGLGHLIQRQILEEEGVEFTEDGKVNLTKYRWSE